MSIINSTVYRWKVTNLAADHCSSLSSLHTQRGRTQSWIKGRLIGVNPTFTCSSTISNQLEKKFLFGQLTPLSYCCGAACLSVFVNIFKNYSIYQGQPVLLYPYSVRRTEGWTGESNTFQHFHRRAVSENTWSLSLLLLLHCKLQLSSHFTTTLSSNNTIITTGDVRNTTPEGVAPVSRWCVSSVVRCGRTTAPALSTATWSTSGMMTNETSAVSTRRSSLEWKSAAVCCTFNAPAE